MQLGLAICAVLGIDPFLLVLFTDHVYNAIDFMGKLCTLMVDWTQYSRAVRLIREAEEEAERARLAAEAEAAERARLAAEAEEAERARLALERDRQVVDIHKFRPSNFDSLALWRGYGEESRRGNSYGSEP